MIKIFSCKETQKIFNRTRSKKFPTDIQRTTMRKLWMIDAATSINDLRIPPSNHLKKLHGSRKKYYSIRINAQWRICFIWKDDNAYHIKITDYH